MQVTVKLFATLRQTAGWEQRTLDLADDATVGDLLAHLEAQEPALKLTGRAVYAAVNQAYVQVEQRLAAGDLVAIFPPVSGGCERIR